ncbi:uncharacterized protein LOC143514703 [Brachyhypopomus gauderio]|uniref:uncharacterized protein LOC143514703 n=1 Tax=Brachyhypopomus gauderio TaxID=698409 RepID=UPI00404299B4
MFFVRYIAQISVKIKVTSVRTRTLCLVRLPPPSVTERRADLRHPKMQGYTTRPKKALRTSKRHHRSSSSPPRRITPPTREQLMSDPVCALQLTSAQKLEERNPELAELFRQGAVRIWRERHSPPSRTLVPTERSPGEICVADSTPEAEFGEGDSEEEEQDEEEEAYPPSLYDASTVNYGGEEEEDYPPSLDDASTIDYGEEEEESEAEDYLPLPVGPSSVVEEGKEDDDEDYPPSERSAHPADYGEEEEGYEEDDRPLSVRSGVSECTDSDMYSEEEGSPPPSECSVGTVKGRRSSSSGRSGGESMDCSRGGSPEQPMSWSRGSEAEEMEVDAPTVDSGGRSRGEMDVPYDQLGAEFASRAAPGTSASRAAPGGGYAAGASGTPPTAAPVAPVAPGLSPLLALLLARSLAPMSCGLSI